VDAGDLESNDGLRPDFTWLRPLLRPHAGETTQGDGNPKYQVDGSPRTSGPGFGVTLHEDSLELPRRWAAPRLIFVNSMSDLFHQKVPVAFVERVFTVMAETPWHTYQLLTKRSKRLAEVSSGLPWPENVWIGVSIESAAYRFRLITSDKFLPQRGSSRSSH